MPCTNFHYLVAVVDYICKGVTLHQFTQLLWVQTHHPMLQHIQQVKEINYKPKHADRWDRHNLSITYNNISVPFIVTIRWQWSGFIQLEASVNIPHTTWQYILVIYKSTCWFILQISLNINSEQFKQYAFFIWTSHITPMQVIYAN